MLSDNMTIQLNKQLNREFYSSYLYLAMSAWCTHAGYKGAASWFIIQHEEERVHAFKIYNYLLGQGSKIELHDVKNPPIEYTSLLECFQNSLAHEQKMSHSLNELCDLSNQEKDHATYGFLQWFVQEQVEEESSVLDIVSKLKLISDGNGIFLLDSQLLQRQAGTQEVK
ncbi:MAG: ferritin [Sulfurimonas sp.]|nr:ferritin [Sulfurimonas sp.]